MILDYLGGLKNIMRGRQVKVNERDMMSENQRRHNKGAEKRGREGGREYGRCYTIGFEDGGRGLEPSCTGSLHVETRKNKNLP